MALWLIKCIGSTPTTAIRNSAKHNAFSERTNNHRSAIADLSEAAQHNALIYYSVFFYFLFRFCSFSTKAGAQTRRPINTYKGSFCSVLHPLCAFVILKIKIRTLKEIFKVKFSKFPTTFNMGVPIKCIVCSSKEGHTETVWDRTGIWHRIVDVCIWHPRSKRQRCFSWSSPPMSRSDNDVGNISKVQMRLYQKQWQTWYKLILTMNGKLFLGFRMAYLHLTLAHSKAEGQGHADFDNEYLGNDDREDKNYYCHQVKSHTWLLHIYIWIWAIVKVKVKILQISTVNNLGNCGRLKILLPPNQHVMCGFRLAY